MDPQTAVRLAAKTIYHKRTREIVLFERAPNVAWRALEIELHGIERELRVK